MGLFTRKPRAEELTGAVILAVIADEETALVDAGSAFLQYADPTDTLVFLYQMTHQLAPVLRTAAEATRAELATHDDGTETGTAIATLSQALLVDVVDLDGLKSSVGTYLYKTVPLDTRRLILLGLADATGRTLRRLGITPRFN